LFFAVLKRHKNAFFALDVACAVILTVNSKNLSFQIMISDNKECVRWMKKIRKIIR